MSASQDPKAAQLDPLSPLGTAIRAAGLAAERIRARYAAHLADRAALVVEQKEDASPVTVADREAEAIIAEVLRGAYPDYGFYGEETGRSGQDRERQWLVDPIDGTKSFLAGLGHFVSTQIALLDRDSLVVGVSSAPMVGELAFAEQGAGAWIGGRKVAVSKVTRLEDAALSFGNVQSMTKDARWERLGALIRRVRHRRGFGDWYQYHRLADGSLDVVIESDVSILDVAALAVIVREAGGKITDITGEPLTLESRSVVATNGRLHDAVLEALRT